MEKEKISKEQKKRPGVYQSGETPKHFKNEGGEYLSDEAIDQDNNNDTKENADFDKINGKTSK